MFRSSNSRGVLGNISASAFTTLHSLAFFLSAWNIWWWPSRKPWTRTFRSRWKLRKTRDSTCNPYNCAPRLWKKIPLSDQKGFGSGRYQLLVIRLLEMHHFHSPSYWPLQRHPKTVRLCFFRRFRVLRQNDLYRGILLNLFLCHNVVPVPDSLSLQSEQNAYGSKPR